MMSTLTKTSLGLAILVALPALGTQLPLQSYVPPDGFVPDKVTAARIAEAVLLPIYGRALVSRQLPLAVRLEDSVWVVEGRPPRKETLGGVALVKISKKSGAIVHMSHGK